MTVSKETAKIAGRIASIVTIERLRGMDVEQAGELFAAIQLMAEDAMQRFPTARTGLTDLLQELKDSMKPKVMVTLQ